MMQRAIKFRAWDRVSQSMRRGAEHSLTMCLMNSNDFELMQYTGLKDKNGTEIYEFDWLSDGIERPMLVVWDRYGWYPFTKNTMSASKMEVKGNKYED